MKSGLGAYAVQVGDLQVGAVVAVNAVGDVLDENGQILAGMRSRDGQGFADTRRVMLEEAGQTPTLFSQRAVGTTTNTTIGAVVTNGQFDKAQLKKSPPSAATALSGPSVPSIRRRTAILSMPPVSAAFRPN